MTTTTTPWVSRIVSHDNVSPDQLLANPANWRIHPKEQQQALSALIADVGYVQSVIVNQRTGHVVDGHLRVSLAISRSEPTIPVSFVDLSLAEEQKILLFYDPLGAMAATDRDQLATLLATVEIEDDALKQLAAQLNKPPSTTDVAFQANTEPTINCPTCGQKLKKGASLSGTVVTPEGM